MMHGFTSTCIRVTWDPLGRSHSMFSFLRTSYLRTVRSFVFHVSIFAYYSYLRTVWSFVLHASILAYNSYLKTVRSYSMLPFLRTIVTWEPFEHSYSMFPFLRPIVTREPFGLVVRIRCLYFCVLLLHYNRLVVGIPCFHSSVL